MSLYRDDQTITSFHCEISVKESEMPHLDVLTNNRWQYIHVRLTKNLVEYSRFVHSLVNAFHVYKCSMKCQANGDFLHFGIFLPRKIFADSSYTWHLINCMPHILV